MPIDEQKFNAILNTIINMYTNKKIKLELVSVDHIRGNVILKLTSLTKCPRCVRSSIMAKLRNRFKHIKRVDIIR